MSIKKILRIEPNITLNNLFVFDINSNKEYFNQGLIKSEIRTKIPEKITKLFQTKKDSSLLMPGYVLEHLVKENPELVLKLKDHIKKNHVSLVAQTYFGTNTQILSEKETINQINKHQNILEKHLGKKADTVLLNNVPTKNLLKLVGCENVKLENNSKSSLTSMQNNVLNELKKFQPKISKLDDENLKNDFYLLANNQILNRINTNPELNESSNISTQILNNSSSNSNDLLFNSNNLKQFNPYEEYTSTLNILNNVAHKMNAKILSETGELESETEISETPSKLLLD